MDSGFVSAYPPPGEVESLGFVSKTGLQWDAERSIGAYHVYRDLIANLRGFDYGICLQDDLPTPEAEDTEIPPGGDCYFYLVTSENLLGEEGSKGFRSDGVSERQGTICP